MTLKDIKLPAFGVSRQTPPRVFDNVVFPDQKAVTLFSKEV